MQFSGSSPAPLGVALSTGLFSRCRPDETRQDKSSLGGNKSFIYVKFCNICGGPNELPASLSPSLPHCGRVSTLSGITISRPSLSPFLRLKNCSTGAHLSINVAGIGTGAKVATATATGAAAVAQSLHSFLYFPLSVFCFQFSASVFTVLTMCRYLPLAGRFHVPFARSLLLLLLLLELSTHSQTT